MEIGSARKMPFNPRKRGRISVGNHDNQFAENGEKHGPFRFSHRNKYALARALQSHQKEAKKINMYGIDAGLYHGWLIIE